MAITSPETFHLSDADYTNFISFVNGQHFDYEMSREKALSNLKDKLTIPLPKFIAGLDIDGVGEKVTELLIVITPKVKK